jgi:hypothetical protein
MVVQVSLRGGRYTTSNGCSHAEVGKHAQTVEEVTIIIQANPVSILHSVSVSIYKTLRMFLRSR